MGMSSSLKKMDRESEFTFEKDGSGPRRLNLLLRKTDLEGHL
jgi:hypothetical protein